MEQRVQYIFNGQEVQTVDLNATADSAGLADDRVFAELVRILAFDGTNVARGIMPYGVTAPGVSALPPNFGVIAPNGGTGSVKVYPFRAFVGSRTIVGTDAKANWRDIRSGIAIAAATAFQTVTIPANASGNPRWDLVYATITPDTGAIVTRYVKDPTTGAEGTVNFSPITTTTVTLGDTTGLPGVNPGFPPAPPDVAGVSYVIPLAYVRVPNGFGAGSTVGVNDIFEIAPIVSLAPTSGTVRVGPASGVSTSSGILLRNPWPISGNRPGPYLPPSMVGMECRFFGIDLISATKSINSGDIIDSSMDWRNRWFLYFAQAQNNALTKFAYDPSHAGTNVVLDDSLTNNALGNQNTFGFGQSFLVNAAPEAYVAWLTNAKLSQITAATNIRISVDMTTGALKVFYSGAPAVMLFATIFASGPFPNT